MIVKNIESEFGTYRQKLNHGHKVGCDYVCIDAFSAVENPDEWMSCPCCKLKPKTWVFDNGCQTACGCGNSIYDHFSVFSESIMSVYKRCDGMISDYSRDNLRLNWNEYCATMVNPCSNCDLRLDGKW